MSPLQNRVTPRGALEAVAVRYPVSTAAFGNRGVLHNNQRQVSKAWQNKAWLACKLIVDRKRKVQKDDNRAFNERKRTIMRPGSYTELFFLDHYVATAAGHRPCACCRRKDYDAFVQAWGRAHPAGVRWTARTIDEQLHTDRLSSHSGDIVWEHPLSALPDGTFVALASHEDNGSSPSDAFLSWQGNLMKWSHEGYCACIPHNAIQGHVRLVTPKSLVKAMREGFVPGRVDESALRLMDAMRHGEKEAPDAGAQDTA